MAKSRKRDSGMPVVQPDAGAPQFSGDTTAADLDRERIAERAYQLFIDRGANDGRDLDDWLEAERQLARRTDERHTTVNSGA
jgi:hypothetical protein